MILKLKQQELQNVKTKAINANKKFFFDFFFNGIYSQNTFTCTLNRHELEQIYKTDAYFRPANLID